MGTGEPEHHVAGTLRQAEQQTREIGGNSLTKRSEKHYQGHNPEHVKPLKQRTDINQHAHTYQEIWNEQGVADKLDAIHQR